jgi:hypothetical protein
VVFGGDGVLDEVQVCTVMTMVCCVGALASCNDERRWLEVSSASATCGASMALVLQRDLGDGVLTRSFRRLRWS